MYNLLRTIENAPYTHDMIVNTTGQQQCFETGPQCVSELLFPQTLGNALMVINNYSIYHCDSDKSTLAGTGGARPCNMKLSSTIMLMVEQRNLS